MNTFGRSLAIAAAIWVCAACPVVADENAPEVTVTEETRAADRSLAFEQESVLLFTWKSFTQKPTVTRLSDSAPVNTWFNWTSSDPAIAKVGQNGTVTGVSKGTCTITATAKDDSSLSVSYTVNVALAVKTVSIDGTLEGNAGKIYLTDDASEAYLKLKAYVYPEDALYGDVEWISSNDAVASVDENGLVTGHAVGVVSITAVSTEPATGYQQKRATVKVSVMKAVTGITLSRTEGDLEKGEGATLKATVEPQDAAKKSVMWVSSDTSVATVTASGYVKGVGVGECYIICTAADGNGASAACHVVVEQKVTGFKLPSKLTVGEGMTEQIAFTVLPADASDKRVMFLSSDNDIATVSQDGVVTGVRNGDCVIMVSAQDGSGKTARVPVHVPSFAIAEKEIEVTDKGGYLIAVTPLSAMEQGIKVTGNSKAFETVLMPTGILIRPLKAGKGTLKLSLNGDSATVSVTVAHSAVYDNISYPEADRNAILGTPEEYTGNNIQVTGVVQQRLENQGKVQLRVGTSGYNDLEGIYWIECDKETFAEAPQKGDEVCVYGVCTGTYSYASVGAGKVTVPAITAEKIDIK